VTAKMPVAIIGSGNIGTDLMVKILRADGPLEIAAVVGVDISSDGLARARAQGVATTSDGIDGLLDMPAFDRIELVFDATSAGAHARHDAILRAHGKRVIDLTPAALGPYVVPPVNLTNNFDSPNVNMVTCGGQATIPIVWAVGRAAPVIYGEIVASIASRSAGPGTRANIDEFTETTARGVEAVGGAGRGKAIIVLNPAEPPLIMRNSVICLTGAGSRGEMERSVLDMVATVRQYVPGYALRHPLQFEPATPDMLSGLAAAEVADARWKVTAYLEVAGAADYLPAYAGNLDIMTAAALRTAQTLALGRRAA
jgi:acetaldehyde dehydrogenase